MLESRDRILTTHVGSLPRNPTLSDLLIRREAGEVIPAATMAAEMDRADIDTLVRRTKAAKTRPLLMGYDPRAVLEHLMVVRRPLYEGAADLRIETTGRQVRAVAADIQQRLGQRVAKQTPT